jgi:citrate lyase subunit beta / citryl-CoA lyase
MPSPGFHAEALRRLRLRSLLLTAADDRRRLDAARGLSACGIILDLGAAAGTSKLAGKILAEFRAQPKPPLLLAQVGALDSGRTDHDLGAIMSARPDGIVLPAALGGRDIARLGAKLAVHEAEQGIEDGTTRILACAAASASAVLALACVAGASRRLAALVFDPEPLAAELGVAVASEPIRHARSMLLLAARAAGAAAIEGPSPLPRDATRFSATCREARTDGFAGKIARDPEEVAIINATFA